MRHIYLGTGTIKAEGKGGEVQVAPAQRGEKDPEGGKREGEPHPGHKAGTLSGPVYGLHGAKICRWNEEGASHGDVGSCKWLGSWLDSG